MITREVFFKQWAAKRAEFKKQKLEIYPDYPTYFYLVTTKKDGSKKVTLKKFKESNKNSGREERMNYLRYNISKHKEKGLNKLYPLLEEVKFKELIIDLPISGYDPEHSLEYTFTPAGILFGCVSKTSKRVETTLGVYPTVRKYKLLIPEKYFKDGKRRK